MEQPEILKIFEQNNAFLAGHFLLSSGLHSDRYLQTALVLQEPATALLLGGELAKRFSGEPVSIVIGPALGGVVIAFAVANGLEGSRAIFAERQEGKMVCMWSMIGWPTESNSRNSIGRW